MFDRTKGSIRDLLRTIPFVFWLVLRLFLHNRRACQAVHDPIRGRVLVFATNAIGDTVTLLPALQRVINDQRPVKVDVLVRPKTAPLFKFVPGVGEVIIFEKLTFPFKPRALFSNIATLKRLRRRRYASALIFSSNFWTAWIAFLMGAEKRYGFSRTEKVGLATVRNFGFLLTHDQKEVRSANYVEAHYEFLDWLRRGSNEPRVLPEIKIGRQTSGLSEEIMKLAAEKPMVVLNPFASQGIREWPLPHWVELAIAMGRHSVFVVVCCEAHQQKRLDAAFGRVPSNVVVRSDLNLEDFICLLGEATSVVTNDSGPLHLSYALGKPSVAIFGPTDHRNVVPRGAPVTIVRRTIDCSPCVHLGSFEKCPLTHHRCINELTVNDVLAPVLTQLGTNALLAAVRG